MFEQSSKTNYTTISSQNRYNVECSDDNTHSIVDGAAIDDTNTYPNDDYHNRINKVTIKSNIDKTGNISNSDCHRVNVERPTYYETSCTTRKRSSSSERMSQSEEIEFSASKQTHSSVNTDQHKREGVEQILLPELEEEEEETITVKKETRHLSISTFLEQEGVQDEWWHDVKDKSALHDSSEHLRQEQIAKNNSNSISKSKSKSNTTPVFSSVENVRQSS